MGVSTNCHRITPVNGRHFQTPACPPQPKRSELADPNSQTGTSIPRITSSRYGTSCVHNWEHLRQKQSWFGTQCCTVRQKDYISMRSFNSRTEGPAIVNRSRCTLEMLARLKLLVRSGTLPVAENGEKAAHIRVVRDRLLPNQMSSGSAAVEQDRCSRRATRMIVRPSTKMERCSIVQAVSGRLARG